MVEFTILLHHGRGFIGPLKNKCIEGNICTRKIDKDMISYQCAKEILKEIGFEDKEVKGIYYKKFGACEANRLELFYDDALTKDMVKVAVDNGYIELHVDHIGKGPMVSNGEHITMVHNVMDHLNCYHVGLELCDVVNGERERAETINWSHSEIDHVFDNMLTEWEQLVEYLSTLYFKKNEMLNQVKNQKVTMIVRILPFKLNDLNEPFNVIICITNR